MQEPANLMNEIFGSDYELNIEKKLSDMSFQLPKCQIRYAIIIKM